MTLRTGEETVIEGGSSRSHYVESSFWKRLWTCRKTDYWMNKSRQKFANDTLPTTNPKRTVQFSDPRAPGWEAGLDNKCLSFKISFPFTVPPKTIEPRFRASCEGGLRADVLKIYRCNNVRHSAMNLERVCYCCELAYCKTIEAVICLYWHMIVTNCHTYCNLCLIRKCHAAMTNRWIKQWDWKKVAHVMKGTHESHQKLRRM